MTLYQIIKSLQNAEGNLAKEAILQQHKDNELFKLYMKAVYDVGINYYIKKVEVNPHHKGPHPITAHLINDLVATIAGRVLTGKAAIEGINHVMYNLDAEGQELLSLIFDRSIGANVGDTMVLNTWPDLYFIPPYMRCSKMDEKVREHYGTLPSFYVQTKRDGSFGYLSTTAIHTRQGSAYPQWLVKRLSFGLTSDEVLVGEMEVEKDGKLLSRKEGNGILNSVLKGADESEFEGYVFKYVAWDYLTADEYKAGKSDKPYFKRWYDLLSSLDRVTVLVTPVESVEVFSVAQANAVTKIKTKRGEEGAVWKTKDGLWRNSSSGTLDAVKVKVVFEVDMVITGYFEGKGKAKGMLGGVETASRDAKVQNKCGSGFSDKQRRELWEMRTELPGMILTMEANDILSARGKDTFSLSLPIAIELRFDKKVADSYEEIVAAFEAAKNT